MEEKHVVTNFLEFENKILILRRSGKVGTYQNMWAGVSGYVQEDPDKQAIIEIREETGLSEEDIELVRKGEPLSVIDEELNRRWVVHSYRWQVSHPQKIRIDWEHKQMKWIKPQDLSKYRTVPKLRETWDQVK